MKSKWWSTERATQIRQCIPAKLSLSCKLAFCSALYLSGSVAAAECVKPFGSNLLEESSCWDSRNISVNGESFVVLSNSSLIALLGILEAESFSSEDSEFIATQELLNLSEETSLHLIAIQLQPPETFAFSPNDCSVFSVSDDVSPEPIGLFMSPNVIEDHKNCYHVKRVLTEKLLNKIINQRVAKAGGSQSSPPGSQIESIDAFSSMIADLSKSDILQPYEWEEILEKGGKDGMKIRKVPKNGSSSTSTGTMAAMDSTLVTFDSETLLPSSIIIDTEKSGNIRHIPEFKDAGIIEFYYDPTGAEDDRRVTIENQSMSGDIIYRAPSYSIQNQFEDWKHISSDSQQSLKEPYFLKELDELVRFRVLYPED